MGRAWEEVANRATFSRLMDKLSDGSSKDAAYPRSDCHRERTPKSHAGCGAKHISAPKVRSYSTQGSKKNQRGNEDSRD